LYYVTKAHYQIEVICNLLKIYLNNSLICSTSLKNKMKCLKKNATYTLLIGCCHTEKWNCTSSRNDFQHTPAFHQTYTKNTGSSTKYELPVFSSPINTRRHLFLYFYFSL